MDSVRFQRKKGNPRQPARTTNKINSTGCGRCGNSTAHPRDKCPARDAKCHKCGIKGHFAKACRKANIAEVDRSPGDRSEWFLGSVDSKRGDPWMTNIKIRGHTVKFKIDTGADVTVIPESEYKQIKGIKLLHVNRSLHGPGNTKLNVLGKFLCELESKSVFSVQEIYVVRGLSQALLGRPAIIALHIIEKVNIASVNAKNVQTPKSEEYFRDKFSTVFNGLGKSKWKYKINLKENSKPYALSSPRKVPFAQRDKVKEELDRMQNLGVISKVDEPTEWCAPMVIAPKPNGQVRICVDLKKLNESVKRENHPLPSVDESLSKLSGSKIFSKLDANSGFWQINLAPESRLLTTFITPYGRFYFNRLPFGINSASEFFQKRMSEILCGIEGVLCHMDDILIFATTQGQHDAILENILSILKDNGLTLNNKKCEFSKSSVTFLGHVIDEKGIRVESQKVKAILDMRKPENVSDIRRFLGMVNQLNRFSPKLAERSQPLRELLKLKNAWMWGPAQERSFESLKAEIAQSPCLMH
ncbi:uncharacterized protein K02A2.6-like [Ostrea edulis]|uniref:uncharacterized protein K02A2.6-like n=1 Tax=Ostrea edulis TaxID=37623 RepID=UPI0024AF3AF6|nr:uncharacterized protein K02A2.6-like [Ostrea edulis]